VWKKNQGPGFQKGDRATSMGFHVYNDLLHMETTHGYNSDQNEEDERGIQK
jgi:hypothetical protein